MGTSSPGRNYILKSGYEFSWTNLPYRNVGTRVQGNFTKFSRARTQILMRNFSAEIVPTVLLDKFVQENSYPQFLYDILVQNSYPHFNVHGKLLQENSCPHFYIINSSRRTRTHISICKFVQENSHPYFYMIISVMRTRTLVRNLQENSYPDADHHLNISESPHPPRMICGKFG